MRKLFVLLILSMFCQLHGKVLEIDVPEPVFEWSGNEVVPVIEGYLLDGTGEKLILPYKTFSFSSKIVKIEVVEKKDITTPAPLKKGEPLYRIGDMVKVMPVSTKDTLLPSAQNFYFVKTPTIRRGMKEYSVSLYPVIAIGDNEITYMKKIRIHFENKTAQHLSPTHGRDSILILTSEEFISGSKELSTFIDTKRSQGFRVEIATEKDYKAEELKGLERAKEIRKWLATVYADYYFLLIIADPSPRGSDVPMIVARPNIGEVEKNYEETATDVFYGELTEDIDKNRNGIPGERGDEINLAFELVVGRIPFYDKRFEDADKILARTVRYIKEKPSVAKYRRDLLFPTSIAYYAQQDGQMFTPKMDGAYVARYIEEKVLKENFTSKVLVETEGESPSEYSDIEESLNSESMLKSWNDNYGIIYWMGHGLPSVTVRTIWLGDRKNVGYPSSWDMKSEAFVTSDMTLDFGDHTSPFVFQGSCLNGKIENDKNLGFYTLLNSAVGVITSSQVAYGSIRKDYDLSSQDLFSYGVMFVDALVNNRFPAMVLQQRKENWSNHSVLLTMKYAVNYLGDPSLHLNSELCEKDSDCDDGLFCNGKEVCNEGFCERKFDALPCLSETENVCTARVCDEKTKGCVVENRVDGTYCGEKKDNCFKGMKCLSGECIDWGETDCSHLDSECSNGFCNPDNGDCEAEEINEGGECDDGYFCTENDKCVKGTCSGTEKQLPDPIPCSRVVCDNNLQEFSYLIDSGQNWEKCEKENGAEGYCYYGVCKVTDEPKSGSAGCSVTVF
jgi:hypothetical protein